mmetsp:Transcript_119419/g.380874  ORF Transcript_119419/g.380874 Transcript_119419/m.380874 type:complete len:952 (+) Transcript_119419:78-2933(+)
MFQFLSGTPDVNELQETLAARDVEISDLQDQVKALLEADQRDFLNDNSDQLASIIKTKNEVIQSLQVQLQVPGKEGLAQAIDSAATSNAELHRLRDIVADLETRLKGQDLELRQVQDQRDVAQAAQFTLQQQQLAACLSSQPSLVVAVPGAPAVTEAGSALVDQLRAKLQEQEQQLQVYRSENDRQASQLASSATEAALMVAKVKASAQIALSRASYFEDRVKTLETELAALAQPGMAAKSGAPASAVDLAAEEQRLGVRERLVAAREGSIQEREQTQLNAEAAFGDRSAQLAAREQAVVAAEQRVRELESRVHILNEVVAAKESEVASKKQDFAAREQEAMSRLRAQVAKEQEMASKQAAATAALQEQLKAREAACAVQEASLQDRLQRLEVQGRELASQVSAVSSATVAPHDHPTPEQLAGVALLQQQLSAREASIVAQAAELHERLRVFEAQEQELSLQERSASSREEQQAAGWAALQKQLQVREADLARREADRQDLDEQKRHLESREESIVAQESMLEERVEEAQDRMCQQAALEAELAKTKERLDARELGILAREEATVGIEQAQITRQAELSERERRLGDVEAAGEGSAESAALLLAKEAEIEQLRVRLAVAEELAVSLAAVQDVAAVADNGAGVAADEASSGEAALHSKLEAVRRSEEVVALEASAAATAAALSPVAAAGGAVGAEEGPGAGGAGEEGGATAIARLREEIREKERQMLQLASMCEQGAQAAEGAQKKANVAQQKYTEEKKRSQALLEETGRLSEALEKLTRQLESARASSTLPVADGSPEAQRLQSELTARIAELVETRQHAKELSSKVQRLEGQLSRAHIAEQEAVRASASNSSKGVHNAALLAMTEGSALGGLAGAIAGVLQDVEMGDKAGITLVDLGLSDLAIMQPLDKFLQLLSALMTVRADARLAVFGVWMLCHLIYVVYLVYAHLVR